MFCSLVCVESTSITVRTAHARSVGGFCTRLRRTEDRDFLIRLSRLGAVRILPDALFEKSWSMDGLSNQWSGAGYELVSCFRERPEYIGRYRKVGQYIVNKLIIMHIRHCCLVSFIAEHRRFYSIELLDDAVLHLSRSHLQLKNYRREASKKQALASLIGPPSDWTL